MLRVLEKNNEPILRKLTDKRTDGRTDGRIEGWMVGWTDCILQDQGSNKLKFIHFQMVIFKWPHNSTSFSQEKLFTL